MRLSHFGWNLAGLSVPLLAAAITVPHLVGRLGPERFGLLALAWGLIGCAGVLDLGVGRALTQVVSRLRGTGDTTHIGDVLATASRITLVAGLIGGISIALAAFAGASAWVRVATTSPAEIETCMLLLAIALPAQAMSATYKGLCEAFLDFKGINLVRAGLGVVHFAGPYVVTVYTVDLPWSIATLVLSRLLALLIFYWLANLRLDDQVPRGEGQYSKSVAKSLFAFGGWVTVSSVAGPLLLYADRFLIGASLSASAVTSYVLPYEVVIQSMIPVGVISSVMFPMLCKLIHNPEGPWQPYFRRWLYIIAGTMFALTGGLALSLPAVLGMWLKTDLQPESVFVGQVLCLGVFANSIGAMYYALLHAKGRADLTAKLHLIELPIFFLVLIFLLDRHGIVGAAWAWVARMVFDAAVLAWMIELGTEASPAKLPLLR